MTAPFEAQQPPPTIVTAPSDVAYVIGTSSTSNARTEVRALMRGEEVSGVGADKLRPHHWYVDSVKDLRNASCSQLGGGLLEEDGEPSY